MRGLYVGGRWVAGCVYKYIYIYICELIVMTWDILYRQAPPAAN